MTEIKCINCGWIDELSNSLFIYKKTDSWQRKGDHPSEKSYCPMCYEQLKI